MKDAKFIELLNLYVDHQISPEEAEQLEAEVRRSPERRQVYHEYCQMQKACSVIADAFRSEAPASAPNVADFKVRRSPRSAALYVGGLLAAAACVAVVLNGRSGPRANPSPAVPALAATAPSAAAAFERPALRPVMGPRLLTVREPGAESSELAAVEHAAFGEWMNNVQLSRLAGATGDELQFDTRATVPAESRGLHARRPYQGNVEWTAFTFQK